MSTTDTGVIEHAWEALHQNQPLPDVAGVLSIAVRRGSALRIDAYCVLLAAARTQDLASWDIDVEALTKDALADAREVDDEAVAAVLFRANILLMGLGIDGAEQVVAFGTSAVGRPGVPDGLRGALLCQLFVAEQRVAMGHFVEAHLLATPGEDGPGATDPRWHTEFGPGNVAAHRIAALMEAGCADGARKVFETSDLSDLSPERIAHVRADLFLEGAEGAR